MKKLLLGTILIALPIAMAPAATAEVGISIGIALPPPVVFVGPPEVIVIPDTDDVYVVPDVDVDIFFWNGWWWRPWEGRWYRSRYHNRGWAYYRSVPSFYFDVDPGWRGYYRSHDWHGHRWDYQRIPDQRLRQNWRGWHDNRYWQRRGTWGVQGYRPPPRAQKQELRREREVQYRQRPEVQRHEQERREQRNRPQARTPQGREQGRPRVQEPARPQHQPQAERPQRPQQQERSRPQVERPQGPPPQERSRPQVERPRGPQPQERSQPRGPERQGESRREQPQGRPERGDAGPR